VQSLTPDPEEGGGDDPEGAVGVGELVVARRQRTELLVASNEVLNQVALAVDLAIERAATWLAFLMGDGVADASSAAIGAVASARIRLVTHHAVRPQARTTATRSSHRSLFEQLLEHRRFVLLSRCQQHSHQLAAAFGSDVDLGAEPTLAAPERLRRRAPFFAPAACWWARMTVPSTKCTFQSSWPAASACCWTAANSRSHTPAKRQRRKRLWTVDQEPYRSGTSRQGAPVRSFHRIAFRIRRWSSAGRPLAGFCGGSSGASLAHSASVSS